MGSATSECDQFSGGYALLLFCIAGAELVALTAGLKPAACLGSFPLAERNATELPPSGAVRAAAKWSAVSEGKASESGPVGVSVSARVLVSAVPLGTTERSEGELKRGRLRLSKTFRAKRADIV